MSDPAQSYHDDTEMFELAPVSLWLEDYSELKQLLDQWREQGVTDLRAHLTQDRNRVSACMQRIRVIKVNRATLSLFEAQDLGHLVENLPQIFRGEMIEHHIEELIQLWGERKGFCSESVNYTVTGKRLRVQVNGSILPAHLGDWKRVLVAIDDLSAREQALNKLALSESYARGLFEHSPVSLWVEDFSAVKELLDTVRFQGITDFRVFIDVHPEFVQRCMQEIRVVDVNQHTLELFGAGSKSELLTRVSEVFRDDMSQHFKEQLIDLWNGKLFQQREVVNYSLEGTRLHLHLQFSVLPGFEQSWDLVLVALTDITARKKAEAYLEFLGKHDVLTKLRNRSYYVDELNRLDRKGPFPVTVVIVDLNNLKQVNDQLGHAAGDALLRRVGEVLAKAVEPPVFAARTGGDEFAILLPATDERGGNVVIDRIRKLVDINNQYYSSVALSLSIGAATSLPNERPEATAQRADAMMYADKRSYHDSLRARLLQADGQVSTLPDHP